MWGEGWGWVVVSAVEWSGRGGVTKEKSPGYGGIMCNALKIRIGLSVISIKSKIKFALIYISPVISIVPDILC